MISEQEKEQIKDALSLRAALVNKSGKLMEVTNKSLDLKDKAVQAKTDYEKAVNMIRNLKDMISEV